MLFLTILNIYHRIKKHFCSCRMQPLEIFFNRIL